MIQIYFLNRSDKTARIAAEAAKQSADAAVRKDAPWLNAKLPQVWMLNPSEKQAAETGIVFVAGVGKICRIRGVTIVNIGGTTAKISGFEAGWEIAQSLSSKPRYKIHRSLTETFILPDDAYDFEVGTFTIEVEQHQLDAISDRRLSFWFFCTIIYSDFMNALHHSNFCWKWDESAGMGILKPDGYAPAVYREKT
jgi:hypothetical protein